MANQTRRFSTSESAVQGAVQPRYGEVRIRQRGRLPHWEKEAGLYFVTFHLADSLPKSVLERIEERHRTLEAARRGGANLSPSQKVLIAEYSPKKIEEYFDPGIGACSLRDSPNWRVGRQRTALLAREAISAGRVVRDAESRTCDLPFIPRTGAGGGDSELEAVHGEKGQPSPWPQRGLLAT